MMCGEIFWIDLGVPFGKRRLGEKIGKITLKKVNEVVDGLLYVIGNRKN
ncbi:MAG: hypothetical protein KBT11_02855 [Treponema sp.]|nr:hypothetical protein [Candidatus Treponema equifaecale]